MKRLIAIAVILLFCVSNVGFAKEVSKTDTKGKTVKVEKKVKTEKKVTEKQKVKKSETPKGVEKAAEKGKGEKKGLWQRWFGGSKEKAKDTEKTKATKGKK